MAASVFWSIVALVAIGHALGVRGNWMERYQRLPAPLRGLGYAAVLTMILFLTPMTGKTFIYFQF